MKLKKSYKIYSSPLSVFGFENASAHVFPISAAYEIESEILFQMRPGAKFMRSYSERLPWKQIEGRLNFFGGWFHFIWFD